MTGSDGLARAALLRAQRETALRDLEVIRAHDGAPYPDLVGLTNDVTLADADLD